MENENGIASWHRIVASRDEREGRKTWINKVGREWEIHNCNQCSSSFRLSAFILAFELNENKWNPFSINFSCCVCDSSARLFMLSFYHVHWHNDYIKHTAYLLSLVLSFATYLLALIFWKLNKSVCGWAHENLSFSSPFVELQKFSVWGKLFAGVSE